MGLLYQVVQRYKDTVPFPKTSRLNLRVQLFVKEEQNPGLAIDISGLCWWKSSKLYGSQACRCAYSIDALKSELSHLGLLRWALWMRSRSSGIQCKNRWNHGFWTHICFSFFNWSDRRVFRSKHTAFPFLYPCALNVTFLSSSYGSWQSFDDKNVSSSDKKGYNYFLFVPYWIVF